MEQSTPAAAHARGGPLRIAMLGWIGGGNIGNDGCFEAMLLFLRRTYPDSRITAICVDPDYIKRTFGVDALQMRWEPRSLLARALNKLALKLPSALINWAYTARHIGAFDVLIVPGTGLIDNYRTNVLGRPSVLRRWCGAAKRRGVKLAFPSVGADPIRSALVRWAVKPIVEMAGYRSYRDEGSRAYMHSIGVDESKTPVYPDLAWGLPAPAAPPRPADAGVVVGVGVMAYHGWKSIDAGQAVHDAYVAKITQFVDWLADQGHRVRLLIGERSDLRVIDAVTRNARAAGGPAWIDPTPARSLGELMEQIAGVDFVVAARFHNVLCALKMGRPSIAVSYMAKCGALLDQAGVEGYRQDIEDLDVEMLKAQFLAMLADRTALEQTIRARVSELQAKLAEQERVLMERVFVR